MSDDVAEAEALRRRVDELTRQVEALESERQVAMPVAASAERAVAEVGRTQQQFGELLQAARNQAESVARRCGDVGSRAREAFAAQEVRLSRARAALDRVRVSPAFGVQERTLRDFVDDDSVSELLGEWRDASAALEDLATAAAATRDAAVRDMDTAALRLASAAACDAESATAWSPAELQPLAAVAGALPRPPGATNSPLDVVRVPVPPTSAPAADERRLRRLAGSVAEVQRDVLRQWDVHAALLEARRSDADALQAHTFALVEDLRQIVDWYERFALAHATMLAEIARRHRTMELHHAVAATYQAHLRALWERESVTRRDFHTNYGRFLPQSLCPALREPPILYEFFPSEISTSLPHIPDEVKDT